MLCGLEAGASWLSSPATSFLKFSEKESLFLSCSAKSYHFSCDVWNCKSIDMEFCLHWMKHKAVQYFHTIAFCFVLEALVEENVCAGKSNGAVSSLKLVCERRRSLQEEEEEGGGGRVRGEKVLQLNYIVCGDETGADRQMAVDKCCWGAGTGRGGVEGFRSVVTALKGTKELCK